MIYYVQLGVGFPSKSVVEIRDHSVAERLEASGHPGKNLSTDVQISDTPASADSRMTIRIASSMLNIV